MDDSSNDKISYLDLAARVIAKAGKPMSVGEIWAAAEDTGLPSLLNSAATKPRNVLASRLFTDAKRPSSLFRQLGSDPVKFLLKSLEASIPNLAQQIAAQPIIQIQSPTYHERELHPFLVWFTDWEFLAHSRTIRHEKSLKQSPKQNEWIHPDVVGFHLPSKEWEDSVVQLAQNTGTMSARFYSFEVKKSLDFPNLREYFFQAVSNSSWAHEGYLVAVNIDEEPDFQTELRRLSQSFGIGVIQLNITVPDDSVILFPATKKSEIDWTTVDRIAGLNADFKHFINAAARSVKINHPSVDGFDKLLTDGELEAHLQKLRGK